MNESPKNPAYRVRPTRPDDFKAIQEVCLQVYPESPVWKEEQLSSHLDLFPEGQLVAERISDGKIVGMASSLIVNWDDYDSRDPWRDFTDTGYFTNHDPEGGRTLYGAEIMVDPRFRGQGIGRLLYAARREIVENLGLLRIRAGARLRGYCTYAGEMSALEYLWKVTHFKLMDPTLTFQLKQGFLGLALIPGYLRQDPESLGFAALIEWLNPKAATKEDFEKQAKMIEATFSELQRT